jgi:flavin-dependent dehydrogenase
MDYDVIVVGARCAGSPTAMLLARKGYRVLLVDRATFPSDTVSTHVVQPSGVAALRRWGLLDDVIATGCPPLDTQTFDFGPLTISGRPRAVDGVATTYAPRRSILDEILVDAAATAGAEVRAGYSVDGLEVEDGVVAGIRGAGCAVDRARVVIGADGRNSLVARAMEPAHYRDKPRLMQAYYTYWADLDVTGFHQYVRPYRGWGAAPTNDGLTMLVVGWPAAEAEAYRADPEANYLATLDAAPEFAERVRAATRVDRFTAASVPNYFRVPFGPGWALVGDAGYNRDPITAQGISDAFLDAERCTDALDDALSGRRSFDDAMSDYHAARDERVMPMYEFTTQLATLEPPSTDMQQLLAAMSGNQDAMDVFVSVAAGTLPPSALFAGV